MDQEQILHKLTQDKSLKEWIGDGLSGEWIRDGLLEGTVWGVSLGQIDQEYFDGDDALQTDTKEIDKRIYSGWGV